MPEHKKQHYLPAAYLKYFSGDQSNCSRKSKVWRIDSSGQRDVPVDSQCFENYHYSKTQPAEAERLFQPIEAAYCNCIDTIRSGKEATERNLGDLLIFMFDLHIRNKVHQNLTGQEGVEAYKMRAVLFLSEMIGAKPEQNTVQVGKLIAENWRVKILFACPNRILLTSDHPSIWMSLNRHRTVLQLMALPLSPGCVAIAFDRRVVEIAASTQLTSDDCVKLSLGQVQNANQCLYSSRPLTETDMQEIRRAWSRRSVTTSEVKEDGWRFNLLALSPEGYCSFMRRKVPLVLTSLRRCYLSASNIAMIVKKSVLPIFR